MVRPIMMVLDDDPKALQAIQKELSKRYGADYEVICESSPKAALQTVEAARTVGREVALMMADHWMPELTGIEFLTLAHETHPDAGRALLIAWGDRSSAEPILRATALGQIDYYVAKPGDSPHEQFHRAVTEFLEEWSRSHRSSLQYVKVIGEQWTGRSHEVRDLLERNGIPYGFYDLSSPTGCQLLQSVDHASGPFPVLILANGTVLANPSNVAVADALGATDRPGAETYDLVIVGAGPAGLSAAVYAASEGLRTRVIEAEAIGGQAGTSSLIRNYLGFPRGISGGELATRAYQQAWLFGVEFAFIRRAAQLRTEYPQHIVILDDGAWLHTRSVLLAPGVAYCRLGIPGLDGLLGAGVFYGAAAAEARAMQGLEVFVAGAGNSAGQAALHLARYATHVTILARGASLIESMSDYLIREIQASKNITVQTNTEIVGGQGKHRLQALVLKETVTGQSVTVPAAALFVLIGATPHTEWLPPAIARDNAGFILTGRDVMPDGLSAPRWPLSRPPMALETSVPGIFAAGDVRYRSVKRVASAVGEGAVAVQLVHQYLSEVQTR